MANGAALAGVEGGDRPARRLEPRPERGHRRHRGDHGLASRRRRPDHRRAEQDRLGRLGRGDGHAAGVGDDLAHEGARGGAAAGHDRLEGEARAGKSRDNVGDAVGEAAHARDIERLEARHVLAEVEPDDAAARARVRDRRPLADERGQRVQVGGDQRGLGQPGPRHDAPFEHVESSRADLAGQGMHADDPVDRRAESRLPPVHEPLARRQCGKVRSPQGLDEARLVRDRETAARGAEDQGEPPARIAGRARLARAERGERARVRIDEPRPDRQACGQPHGCCGVVGKPACERRPRIDDLGAEPGVTVRNQPAETDAVEELPGPAALVRQVAELAGDRAERAGERPGRAERQIVGEGEKVLGLRERLRLHPVEPGELRNLHLRRQRAADVAQSFVAAGVDARGVLGRAMVHPGHHVAAGGVVAVDRRAARARRRARQASRSPRSRRRRRPLAEGRSNRPPRGRPPSSRARCRRKIARRRRPALARGRPASSRSPELGRSRRTPRPGRCPCRRLLRCRLSLSPPFWPIASEG